MKYLACTLIVVAALLSFGCTAKKGLFVIDTNQDASAYSKEEKELIKNVGWFVKSLEYNDYYRAHELAKNYPAIAKTSIEDVTTLQFAVKENKWTICETLLQNGAPVNHRDNDGYTALTWAIIIGSKPFEGKYNRSIVWEPMNELLIKLLLKHGADPNIPGPLGTTALQLAEKLERNEKVMGMLQKHAEKKGGAQ